MGLIRKQLSNRSQLRTVSQRFAADLKIMTILLKTNYELNIKGNL